MSVQEQRDGGFFKVRGGMAIDITDQVNASLTKDAPAPGRVGSRRGRQTALCSNRGPTSRPIDIRMPAVARREDEIDLLTV